MMKMKRILLLALLFCASLAARAQDPLLPLRLELDSSFALPNSTVYLKIAIHDGNVRNVLWSNSVITPDYDPLYPVTCKLSGNVAYLLLGNTNLSNMEALPRDLFAGGALRKIRVWVSNSSGGTFRQLTPDLDLVCSPYSLYSEESKDLDPAVVAANTESISSLNASLRTANGKISSLQNLSSSLTNGTLALPSANPFLSRMVTGSSGQLVYKAESPALGTPSPPTLPEHFDISYVTYFASPIRLSRGAHPRSVTLYFKTKNEIAPPQAVCIFRSEALISVLASAVSVSTAAVPRCVYTFAANISEFPPGEYLAGLRTTSNYSAIHPYVCRGYRFKTSTYYYPEPELEPSISAVIPPSQTYWKFNDTRELWLEFSTREDKEVAVSSDRVDLPGDLYVDSRPVLTEDQLSGKMSALLGESVFVGEEDLAPGLKEQFVTVSGGTVTGALYVSDLRLPETLPGDLRDRFVTVAGGTVTGALYVSDLRLPETLPDGLSDRFITAGGGSVTGALYVSDLRLPNNGNWYIGSEDSRCDLVLVHSNACLRAAGGDLFLGAAGDIRPLGVIDFSPSQCGRADIPRGETEVTIFASGLTQNSVVCATPAQMIGTAYWVEIDPLGQAKICLGNALDQTVSFHYVLIRK